MRKMRGVIMGVIVAVITLSCSDDDIAPVNVQVSLIDAPADYESVLVDMVDVQVNLSSDQNDENGWQSINDFEPKVYDLLTLTNGKEALLGEIDLPVGRLGQVRLILGANNQLVIGGNTIDLKVLSGSESGLKVVVNADLQEGIDYELVVDFDAGRSVVKAGNSEQYNLKPVLRAAIDARTGAIRGAINPQDVSAIVYAIINEDSVSTYPDDKGAFLIQGLDAGFYTVVAVPSGSSAYSKVSVENTPVTFGEVTNVNVLELIAN